MASKKSKGKKSVQKLATPKPKPTLKVSVTSAPQSSRTLFYVAALIVLLIGAFVLLPNRNTDINTTDSSVLQTTVTYRGSEGKNALELLKATHQVESQSYEVGEFVTGIDGVSAPTGYFWSFSVNGQLAEVGSDQYITKDGDTVNWNLEKIQ